MFSISRDPPEGGTTYSIRLHTPLLEEFPISRDPPEGGTHIVEVTCKGGPRYAFPISRDPPEGGTTSGR